MARVAVAAGTGALLLAGGALAAGEESAGTLSAVEVVAPTPLPGIGVERDRVPSNVQVLRGAAVSDPADLHLADMLHRNLGSVTVNEVQGNPYQPDISYRGFTASPLLGTPQGLSVYMDGVRLNQPFGDVVSWDLVPRAAVSSLTLMPGSNPVFGLNALGGSISVQTKDGMSHPGTALQVGAGSHGRQSLDVEHGGHNDKGLHWFTTASLLRERGWRDDSPTRVGQAFGKLGWLDARSEVALSMAMADSDLVGNGLQEQRLLQRSSTSVYTRPDQTRNRSWLLNLQAQHSPSEDVSLAGNLYYRRIRTQSLNGDLNEQSLDQALYQPTPSEVAALTGAGYTGVPIAGANAASTPFPRWRCLANVLLADEPQEMCNGLLNRSRTRQENFGWSGQWTRQGLLAGHKNQLTAGAAFDSSRSRFVQSSQLGYVNPDRSVTPVDADLPDSAVELDGRTTTWSLWAADNLNLNDVLHLSLAGRSNWTQVRNRDQLKPGGGSGSLDGDHRFQRFNPAAGLTFVASPALTAYAGYSEGSRNPSAVELGCADPASPCRLPNSMAGDPPLKQVVTRTWEAGLRGRIGPKTRWNAGVFVAQTADDILFVADDQAGYGYFKNFGKTRRQGVELGLSSQAGPVAWSLAYTYLDATFQSPETLPGTANSSSDALAPGLDGRIQIRPGDRMPLVPQQVLKLRAQWQIDAAWSAALSMQAISGASARGNENNQHQPDGVNFLGGGRTAGHATFDLSARYKASRRLSFSGQISNLFDRRYASAAQLGATGFDANGNFVARPLPAVGSPAQYPLVHSTFLGLGAPRSVWLSARYEF